jgi:DNA-binding transcriptional LysR family regulator
VDTFIAIRVFRQVVESGSFVTAAERLEMSTPMVSRYVAQLEQRLRVRLLNRNSRTLSLTDAGRLYFERTKAILEDLQDTELELGALNNAPRGMLRITCQSFSASQRLADLLAEYRQRCPEVFIYVSFEDMEVDLVEEGFDIAIRTTHDMASIAPGLIARAVRPTRQVIAASRGYLERRGVPQSPADLQRHDFVGVADANSLSLTGPDGAVAVDMRVVVRFRSSICVANAVAAGIGLAPLPVFYFDDPAFKNKLVPVLEAYPLQEGTLYLAYASRKHVALKIRSFIDFFVEKISSPRPDSLPQTDPPSLPRAPRKARLSA